MVSREDEISKQNFGKRKPEGGKRTLVGPERKETKWNG